jgi:hypothetical protein
MDVTRLQLFEYDYIELGPSTALYLNYPAAWEAVPPRRRRTPIDGGAPGLKSRSPWKAA